MTNELLISVVSLVAALFSALYAARSVRIAQKALSIAQEEFNSKKEKLKLYLIEGINYRCSDDEYIFGFNLSVINQASAPNAIQRIELLITFIRKDGTIGNLILQHSPALKNSIIGHEVTPFVSPVEIAEKSAVTNWCMFQFDPHLIQSGRVDKYTLRVSDSVGEVSEVDSYLIKEYRIV
ncbi:MULTISPECIES: hypothetical protein [unclassified Methylomonas]|uniref:hypothetical protein n=1 Tax=unclassified Methylomonas TaxID=2608980 RepID=UPI000C33AC8C|nr:MULTISPECIES: hypothetical protein [unclassified Methylomonas]NOV32501.1 hypothetical protein [Methylomonas sp. ZR1]PKD37973.1 hypothetical protein CWO84_22250 [Methylomonas sp. Kb3]